jgi:hypothetical protein
MVLLFYEKKSRPVFFSQAAKTFTSLPGRRHRLRGRAGTSCGFMVMPVITIAYLCLPESGSWFWWRLWCPKELEWAAAEDSDTVFAASAREAECELLHHVDHVSGLPRRLGEPCDARSCPDVHPSAAQNNIC